MKTYICNLLCVLAIALPCVLVCFDSLISHFIAVLLLCLVCWHGKHYPKVWRRLYAGFLNVLYVFVK